MIIEKSLKDQMVVTPSGHFRILRVYFVAGNYKNIKEKTNYEQKSIRMEH